MNIKKQLQILIEEEKTSELRIFLRDLDKEERLILIPKIKTIRNQINHLTTANQWQMIAMCQLVCYDNETASRLKCQEISSSFRDLLDWHCPDWISDYINKTSIEHPVHYVQFYNYEEILEWTNKGYLIPCSELIARQVSKLIFTFSHIDNSGFFIKSVYDFTPQNLLKHSITLEEHIWHLFKSPSDINKRPNIIQIRNSDEKNANWLQVFKLYINEEKISRKRVLRECLLASNLNLSKPLTDWFVKLFNEIKPNNSELIDLQEELFKSLNSPNTNVVNNALKFIIKIKTNKSFNSAGVNDYLPILLSSNVKSIITKAEELVKK